MNEVVIPLKIEGVGNLKTELRILKDAIAEASDPEQMAEMVAKAAELADKIKDANEQVAIFTTGSKFEAVSNSFGAIQGDLAALDFEGASEKAQVFAKTLGSLGSGDISKGLRGLTSTISTIGGAFVKLGVQILANPLFLLVTIITAIVVAIGAFLNKIGVLGKIISAVTYPIKLLIDAFKSLTDWLGITQYAAEENAEKVAKANDKAFESSKKRSDEISKNYELEIARAQANGKNTIQLEKDKSLALQKQAEENVKKAREEYRMLNKMASEDNMERRKALRERIKSENDIISDGIQQRKLLEIQRIADEKKAREDAEKERKQKAQQAASNYRSAAAAVQKEVSAAAKLVSDSQKTAQQKEIDDTTAKYDELIKQAKKYKKDVAAVESAKALELERINKEYADAEAKRQEQINKAIQANNDAQLQAQEDFEEQLRILKLSEIDREKDEIKTRYFELIALAEQYGLDTIELEKKRAAELDAIDKKAKDDAKAISLEKIETAKAERDAKLQVVSEYTDSLLNLTSLVVKDQQKLEKINKAATLIQIGIDTAKAISSLMASSQANPLNGITGGLAGAAQFASGILQITANVAKAKALLFNPSGNVSGGSSSSGSSSSSSSTSVSAITPSLSMFGQGNNLNTTGQAQSVETNQNIVVQAIVSETDVTNTQSKINKIQKGSEL